MVPGGPSMLLAAIAGAAEPALPSSGKRGRRRPMTTLSGDASGAPGLGKIQLKRTGIKRSAGNIGTRQPN
jgi:hypothetical protein